MSSGNMSKAHCHGQTAGGKPCGMRPIKGGRYCFNHDPARAKDRAAARRAGGLSRHTPHAGDSDNIGKEIRTIGDAAKIIRYVLDELLVMDNTIPRARTLLACFDSFVKAFEIGELERRISALEAMQKNEQA
jgi:hypothetical protein